jgi:hypothetical protein
MLFHSVFERTALTTERKVIFEEINMYEDEPEELVHDILDEAAWDGSTLGYSILGTHSSLNRINKQAIQQYMAQHYVPIIVLSPSSATLMKKSSSRQSRPTLVHGRLHHPMRIMRPALPSGRA